MKSHYQKKKKSKKKKKRIREGDAMHDRWFYFSMMENPHFDLPNVLRSISNFEREFNLSRGTFLQSWILVSTVRFSNLR